MKKPYIGITGFMSKKEVAAVSNVMGSADRMLMAGVLASSKTLCGQKNKYPNRYPKIKDISGIFSEGSNTLNLIHYNTDEPETLANQLFELTDRCGRNLHGFQLNIVWPLSIEIFSYRFFCKDKVIVLQIGSRAFEMVGNSPEKLAEKIHEEYLGVIDYVLLDPSGGKGQPFDTEKARAYLQALREKNLGIGLGVAGGLSPATLGILEPLAKDFPDLSVDAEGKLRDVNDILDVKAAAEYVSAVQRVFKKY